jgi:ABC-type branched-subunit amino acid transport system ATPase component
MTNPTLLLLDEPVEGLAPLVVQEMLAAIERMRRESDMAIVLVERRRRPALRAAHRPARIDRSRRTLPPQRGVAGQSASHRQAAERVCLIACWTSP